MTCDVGPDLVALALGQLPPDEATKIQVHVDGCAECATELATTRRLFDAGRRAALEPDADSESRLIAAFRAERAAQSPAETADVPPPPARRRRAVRILAMAAPLAAAAAVVVAITLSSRPEHAAAGVDGTVVEGIGTLMSSGKDGIVRSIDRDAGAFAFAAGDEIEAQASPLSLALSLPPGTAAARSGGPPPGRVEIRFAPGARLRRSGAGEVELLAGGVEVSAGPLGEGFVLRRGDLEARVRGTRFSAATAESRLVVVVHEGEVQLGRRNASSEVLHAGEQGLVDAERLLRRTDDERRGADVFLTPRISLRLLADSASAAPAIRATLEMGEGGPVRILPFDGSGPRFLLRLKGADGRDREVKLQRSMLRVEPGAGENGMWRLGAGSPYVLDIDAASLGLDPGSYRAALRYLAYRARSDGAEWLGTVESDPVTFEVRNR